MSISWYRDLFLVIFLTELFYIERNRTWKGRKK